MFNESDFDYYRSSKIEWGYPPGTKMIDFVEDEMRPYIHPHWTTFPPINPMYRYFFASTSFFLFFFGSLGNLLVIHLFTKRKELKSPQHNYLVNLAISDMGMLMSQYPAYAYNVFHGSSWQFGPLACELYGLTGNLFSLASLLTLSAMCLERYKVLVRGDSPEHFTYGKSYLSIFLIWMYSIFFSSGPMVGFGKYIPEGSLETCSYDFLSRDPKNLGFFWGILLTNFGIPLMICTHCNFQMLFATMKYRRMRKEARKDMNMTSLRCNVDQADWEKEIRYAKIVVANTLLWVWLWAPYVCTRVEGIFGDQSTITPLQINVLSLYAKMTAIMSPIILAIGHRKYREVLKDELPFFCTWFIPHKQYQREDMTVGSVSAHEST